MNDDNEAELVAAGAIPLLVALLGPKRTAAVREAAAGALMNLITNADSTAKIVAAGGICLYPRPSALDPKPWTHTLSSIPYPKP